MAKKSKQADKKLKQKKKENRESRDALFAQFSRNDENKSSQKYVLNFSNINNWAQLRLVLANTFKFDIEKLADINDFWDLMWDTLTTDSKIIIYGLGSMAEDMPKEASSIRDVLDTIVVERDGLDIEVCYELSSSMKKIEKSDVCLT